MKINEQTPLFAEERREQIVQLLDARSKILVPELCEHFQVSPATIRTDLRDLESEGRLRRTHGGAIPIGKAGFEMEPKVKQVEHIGEKMRIAAKAAELIEDGDTIALDTGSTTFELAKRLVDRANLTIVTTDLEIARLLENHSDASVILIGGAVRRGFHCTMGPMAVSSLSGLNVDKAFMAANAFSIDKGFTTPNFENVEVKKMMLSIAAESIMLMDSSKIGRISFIKFADMTEIDRLITDTGLNKKTLKTLEETSEQFEVIAV